MSALINLSPSRFSRMFKAQTGISPMQYVKLFRLKRARELLETTWMSVKEVMFKVGISDPSHFVRDFRRMYGMPPGQHRAELPPGAVRDYGFPSISCLRHERQKAPINSTIGQ